MKRRQRLDQDAPRCSRWRVDSQQGSESGGKIDRFGMGSVRSGLKSKPIKSQRHVGIV
jgi:hypothetical protein